MLGLTPPPLARHVGHPQHQIIPEEGGGFGKWASVPLPPPPPAAEQFSSRPGANEQYSLLAILGTLRRTSQSACSLSALRPRGGMRCWRGCGGCWGSGHSWRFIVGPFHSPGREAVTRIGHTISHGGHTKRQNTLAPHVQRAETTGTRGQRGGGCLSASRHAASVQALQLFFVDHPHCF